MREETLLVPKFKIVAGTPGIILSDTVQGTDLKKWSMDLYGGNFRLRALNDAESELVVPITVTRAGYVGIGKTPSVALDVSGDISLTGQIGFTDSAFDAAKQLYKYSGELFFSRFNLTKALNKNIVPGSYAANTYFDLYSFFCVSIQGVFYITVVIEGAGYGINYECILPVSHNMDWVSGYGISSFGTDWFNLTPFIFTGRHFLTDSDEFRVQAKVDDVFGNIIHLRLLQIALPDGTPTYKVTIRHSNEFRDITITELSSTGTDSGTFQTIPSVLSGNKDSTLFYNSVGIATAPEADVKLVVGGTVRLRKTTALTPVIVCINESLELRAGDGTSVGYDINIGYGNYNAAKLVYWGGSTSVKMEVSTAGAAKFASYVSAGTAFRINDGVGTAGQFLRSNGSTGFVANTIQSTDLPSDLTLTNLIITGILRNSAAALDLRAGNGTTGQNIILGYGTGYGNNFIFYGGSTTAKFQISSDGDVYIPERIGIATAPESDVKLVVGGTIRLRKIDALTPVIVCINESLELRAGNSTSVGYDFNIGYGNYNGANLNFWGGSTGLKFQVSSAGVGYFAGQCGATYFQPTSGYKSVSGLTGKSYSFTVGPNQYDFVDGLLVNRVEI